MNGSVRGTENCHACAASGQGDWADLPAPCLDIVDRLKRPRELAEGDALFREGDENAGLHCVSRGVMGLRMTHESGTEVMVGIARPGEVLGARAFLRNGPHRTTAVALTVGAVCTISRHDALRLTQQAPSVHLQLVKRCLHAMDEAQEEKMRMAAMSNRARLCHLLHRLVAEAPGTLRDRAELRLPVSRVDLAQMIGIQPESLSRLFRRLKDDGLIEFSGRNLIVPSVAALAADAGDA